MLEAARQRSRHFAPGAKLGKCELIRQIAVGAMAELYLARTLGNEGLEQLVVVKRILPPYTTSAGFVEMFLDEARLAATLRHPNVARIHDIGLQDDDCFIALEYVHGEDLEHIAAAAEEQGVPIALDAALTLATGLCAGLHYAHEKASSDSAPLQIVHGAVSPSTVLVGYDGAVKLADFGIARAASRAGTTPGRLESTVAYMSPELCHTQAPLDRRSDLYSIGTILYQLTTGRVPFIGETASRVRNQIVNNDAPPPSTFVPDYPPALERIVMRTLARDPARRFATALELQCAIEELARETRVRVSPLVLARLMSTLFPARLEEWEHAKAQGAFFVEQHVVRTLIESGKTADRTGDESRTNVAAAHAAPHASSPPPTMSGPAVATGYSALRGGTLVSSSTPQHGSPAVVQPVSPQVDVTERVYRPPRRASSPTELVRTHPRRLGRYVLVAALAIAGGVAAVIVLHDGTLAALATSPAVSDTEAPPMPAAPAPNAPAARTEAADTGNVTGDVATGHAIDLAVGQVTVSPGPAPKRHPSKARPAKKSRVAKRAKLSRPSVEAASALESEPPEPAKEKSWNVDSPFMPVRTSQ